jgi:hypothetical protein
MAWRDDVIKTILFSAIIISIAPPAFGATSTLNCANQGYSPKEINIQLDSTGISGWRFLNPRAPFPVVDFKSTSVPPQKPDSLTWQRCAQEADIIFFNGASGEALSVAIPYSYRLFDRNRLADEIIDQVDQVTSAQGNISDNLRQKIKPLFDASPGRVPVPEQAIKFAAQIRDRHENREKLVSDLANERTRLLEIQQEVEKWMKPPVASASDNETEKESSASLKDGIIRLGALLFEGIDALESSTAQPPLSECPNPTAESQACTFKFTIFDNGTFKIPPTTWVRLVRFSDGVVRFKVSFFDDQIPVSNSEGYLKVRPEVLERPSSTTWSVTASGGYSVVAQSDRKREDGTTNRPFTLEDPYTGKTLDSFSGTGRLELIQTLQEHARARVDPQFKNGALGGDDKSTTFSVPLWTVDVFGLNGVSGRIGNYTMLNPSRGIAINASGEGFQFNWHSLMIGHIVKSESAKKVPDPENKDTSMTLLRVSGAPGFSIFKHIDLFGVYGEKRDTEKTSPYDHYTWGGQLFFASSPGQPEKQSVFSSLSGSVSYYHSERNIRPQSTSGTVLTDGSGSVWLLDSGLTWLRENGADTKALRSLSILLGEGTGDNPDSKHRDESYLGETATFSGFDSLFLGSSFLDNLQDGSPARTPFGKGLANKFYLGLSYTEREVEQINPLWWIARIAQVSDDAKTTATTLKLHWFHLDEPFQNKRDAGFEAGLQWQIEVPAGVKNSLGCSRYFPGSATRRFFLVDPMQCSLQVSLVLQSGP